MSLYPTTSRQKNSSGGCGQLSRGCGAGNAGAKARTLPWSSARRRHPRQREYWVSLMSRTGSRKDPIKAYPFWCSAVSRHQPSRSLHRMDHWCSKMILYLPLTGYQPPFDFMEACGIRFHDDAFHTPVYDDETMETNVPGALPSRGVVCGGLKTNKWFIENSRVHAEMIVKSVLQKKP